MRVIGLRKDHKVQIRPIIIDEVIEVHFDCITQMNIAGITRIVLNQIIINLNNVMNRIIEHRPVELKGIPDTGSEFDSIYNKYVEDPQHGKLRVIDAEYIKTCLRPVEI